MSEHIFQNDYVQNFIAGEDGAYRTIEPYTNAVVVQLISRIDEDGNERLTPVVSVMLKDAAMQDAIKEYALFILKALPSLPLPSPSNINLKRG